MRQFENSGFQGNKRTFKGGIEPKHLKPTERERDEESWALEAMYKRRRTLTHLVTK